MDTVPDLTQSLAAVPSHDDESNAGDLIEEWLRERTTATVNRDGHGNVIARRGDGETLALVGHHDVVPPAGDQVNTDGSYKITERDGRLYGRGTADMKGAVAAAMCAFRDATVDTGELVFASFVGEETGGRGARGAIKDGFAPAYAVVGEGSTGYSAPGVTDVAVAHKGRRASTITATGERAHASEPEAGVNAIYYASDAISSIRDLAVPTAEVFGKELSGSLVVTEIEGGSAWNVVPETCSITIDERTVPGERADLESITAQPELELSIEQDLPPMACDDDQFAERVSEIAAGVQDGRPEKVIKPHATDAGWLAAAGTSCLVCGPAQPGEAHTATESVSVETLDRCYEIYRKTAEQFGTAPA